MPSVKCEQSIPTWHPQQLLATSWCCNLIPNHCAVCFDAADIQGRCVHTTGDTLLLLLFCCCCSAAAVLLLLHHCQCGQPYCCCCLRCWVDAAASTLATAPAGWTHAGSAAYTRDMLLQPQLHTVSPPPLHTVTSCQSCWGSCDSQYTLRL